MVKIKRFAIEPMFEEDAITRMEELGHTFFIFVNAENEQVAVLYRRADGRYGLIEPDHRRRLQRRRLGTRHRARARHGGPFPHPRPGTNGPYSLGRPGNDDVPAAERWLHRGEAARCPR